MNKLIYFTSKEFAQENDLNGETYIEMSINQINIIAAILGNNNHLLKMLLKEFDNTFKIYDINKLIILQDAFLSGIFFAYALDLAYDKSNVFSIILEISFNYNVSKQYIEKIYQKAYDDDNFNIMNLIKITNKLQDCIDTLNDMHVTYECPNCDLIFDNIYDFKCHQNGNNNMEN